MAEYYPLLAKAVGSLPNSTPETRRLVYERARKALIGQLRTLHPPIPDEDIDRESVELDRAIERLEMELANPTPPAAGPSDPTPPAAAPSVPTPKPFSPLMPPRVAPPGGGVAAERKPIAPLRTRMPTPKAPASAVPPATPPSPVVPVPVPPAPVMVDVVPPPDIPTEASRPVPQDAFKPADGDLEIRPRAEGQRPIAPTPPAAKRPKRRMWIIPVVIGIVIAAVGFAAWKLRDHPETLARTAPAKPSQETDTGKIAERVDEGGKAAPPEAEAKKEETAPAAPAPTTPASPQQQQSAAPPASTNPPVPVAHRAALLVEVKGDGNQQSQVKTFLGTVVWKLNNVSEGPNDPVGLAVEADIEIPEDKLKAVVTFQRNTDASLPASHTIKVNLTVEPGSFSGDVKQISTPQMRREDSPGGDPLAGVSVPIVQNQFLVGLSPGNAETANLDLIKDRQWIDIPMLLSNGRIAKLTFEKSDSGERDLNEAIASWQKP